MAEDSKLMVLNPVRILSFITSLGELKVAELRLGDYVLNPRDQVDYVIQNNDAILALDAEDWILSETP